MSDDLPFPRYAIGATVFMGTAHQTTETLPCPDCKGTKKWFLVSPQSEVLEVACMRCTYHSQRDLEPLVRPTWIPHVVTRTIGQVRVEWPRPPHTSESWDPVIYMCVETGIGSGSLYNQSDLHATEADALAVAQLKCGAKITEWNARPEARRAEFNQALYFKDAHGDIASRNVWSACYHFNALRSIVTEWVEDEHKAYDLTDGQRERLREMVGEDRAYDLDPRNNPVVRLVLAARAALDDDRSPTGLNELVAALKDWEWVRLPEPKKDTL